MRLFGYYAFHSFINQIRKLLKTWVILFIVICAIIGGVIGFGAAMLSDIADGQQTEEVVEEDANEDAAEDDDADATDEVSEEDSSNGWMGSLLGEVSIEDLIELIVGGVILALFVFEIFSADTNGSKIFLPADVNLLFPSPLKPQSVLLFRLMTQIGVILISTCYIGFQIPNLIMNLGLTKMGAMGIILTWFFTIAIGKLLQIFCYIYFSTHEEKKKYLRKILYGCGMVLMVACGIYSRTSGLGYLPAAAAFFNHPASRWIPIWGWLKGFGIFAVEGNTGGTAACGALVVGTIIGLVLIIWRMKVDFYEDAMAKSEETAQLMEVMRAEKSTGFVKRKKDRSEKIRRDGMRHGYGANVFFFRMLYNRFRFAHLGFLTKTSDTYLVAAVLSSVFLKWVLQMDGFMIVALELSVFVFFRTLGNPLHEDTSKDFFRMIPESTLEKLFWSMAGGSVNCVLDLLPAMIVAGVIFMEHPLHILAWLIFIWSIDFYGTSVGTFINLSIPEAISKTVKQIIQVMFIYFGLIPDIAVMAVGMAFGHLAIAAVITAVINMIFGGIFLLLAPMVIDYRGK